MNIDEFNRLIQQEPEIAQSLENAAWHIQAKESTRSLDPITVTALVLFFPVISAIVRRVGLPWVVTLGNYSELWRQKAEAWIQSKMKAEDFDPAAIRAAHEALLQELEKTTDPKTMAAWERLLGILKKGPDKEEQSIHS
ncbi:MAG: hypothetical protein ABIK98_12630 [Pseudomonadota bacterium]|uniref:Uncharacterized protein n=1 Tax=Candidatus Desulfatibia profunda TaxID=2841695 RepID=A0A8J6NNK0_9BACT|nr:hypothetical protein [Candidatus Desulfatibia profunda]MBL7181219.1 hypothetical protein [Desulfobacterales bacterium]